MNFISLVGILGSLILVGGALTSPDKKGPSGISLKDWVFGAGNISMLVYSLMMYFEYSGPVFFVFLTSLTVLASLLVWCKIPQKIAVTLLSIATAGLIYWSFQLFTRPFEYLFLLGLLVLAYGSVNSKPSHLKNGLLTLGSAALTVFSFLIGDMIFAGLNFFFALFSGYYWVKGLRDNK